LIVGKWAVETECTKDAPWDRVTRTGPIVHPDAREVGEQETGYPGGDVVTMKCPNCGVTWREELPQ
jgi:hypothetical protein